MPEVLETIKTELRRLQQEGVEHVFVDDSTLDLLKSAPGKSDPRSAGPKGGTPATSDLGALIDKQKKPARAEPPGPAKPAPTPSAIKPLPQQPAQIGEIPGGEKSEQMDWLRRQLEDCPVCREHLSEHGKLVFGTGNVDADLFFCGEAPGPAEEIQGEPFVGEAGQLLTKIIQAMGLQRDEVYLANILKWCPEQDNPAGNRPPTPEEMNFCLPYLKAQIGIVQPKVIVALGNTAVTGLLGPDPKRRMAAVRGKWHSFDGTPLMITFHPSYLLRNGTLKTKRVLWEDLLQVMEKTGLPVSEKQRGFFLPKS
ncbi:MAG: uracil-DNA glycosylase family protein [Opitutales bacterium]